MIYQVVLSRRRSYRFQMHPKLTEFKIYQAIRYSAVHRHEWGELDRRIDEGEKTYQTHGVQIVLT